MSVQPARRNFTVYQGATFSKRITLLQGGSGSDPEDLSGWSGELPIKDKADGTVLYTLSSTNGGITLGGNLGTIDLYIDSTTTSTFVWSDAVYELFLTDAMDNTDVYLYGNFHVVLF